MSEYNKYMSYRQFLDGVKSKDTARKEMAFFGHKLSWVDNRWVVEKVKEDHFVVGTLSHDRVPFHALNHILNNDLDPPKKPCTWYAVLVKAYGVEEVDIDGNYRVVFKSRLKDRALDVANRYYPSGCVIKTVVSHTYFNNKDITL